MSMNLKARSGFTPLLPTYTEVRLILPVFAGTPKPFVRAFLSTIRDLTGTPQEPLDWSDPDEWIDQRLTGEFRDFAWRLWIESERNVNPRHLLGAYYFINRHGLLDVNPNGTYAWSQKAQDFIDEDPSTISSLDESEGLRQLLGIISTKAAARRGDLFDEWADFVRSRSNYRKERAIQGLLRFALQNLLDRGLVSRERTIYSATDEGIAYALPPDQPESEPDNRRLVVGKAINEYNNTQTERLRRMIAEMPPFQFEHLVRDLLEEMGYEDVTVTRESGDRGVDVVATVQFGITTIREVVQVKRHQGTIGRPTIDQLRGALPYHDAIRGTIITTGNFTSGCPEAALYPGAAPISLIDGDRLTDLLVEHGVGIQKRSATLYEIDTDLFTDMSEEEGIDEALINGQ